MKKMAQFLRRALRAAKWRIEFLGWIFTIKCSKNIFVFGAPFHSNMGDQAQSYCTDVWIKSSYPGYMVRIYDTAELSQDNYRLLRRIKKYCNKKDKVFLHSGYHTTDLYMLEENMQRKVVSLFLDRQIVMLPQTINYTTEEEQICAQKVYNSHPDLVMMCRDEVSYKTAERLFPKCKRLLVPDIVTTMIGTKTYNKQRKGILLCLRNDKESKISQSERKQLVTDISEIDTYYFSDTTIAMSAQEIKKNREKILHDLWEEYAGYCAIITDRYHGTIFSLIANTPVIVISSTDHKLNSGVNWFPASFNAYVRYVPDLREVADNVRNIYAREYEYRLEPYFQNKYYSTLRNRIEGNDDSFMC